MMLANFAVNSNLRRYNMVVPNLAFAEQHNGRAQNAAPFSAKLPKLIQSFQGWSREVAACVYGNTGTVRANSH